MRTSSILLVGLLLLPSTLGCAGPGDRPAAIATDAVGTSATLERDLRAVQRALIDERITG